MLQLIERRDIEFFVTDMKKTESNGNWWSPLSQLSAFEAEAPIFMTNPLFLHFCFWFLSDSAQYFTLDKKEKAHEILHSYIHDRIIDRRLGSQTITEKFPAINFQRALQTKDHINTKHFERILQRFHKIKYWVVDLNLRYVDSWILNHILPTCSALSVEYVREESRHCLLPKFLQSNKNNVNILLSDYYQNLITVKLLPCLLQTAAKWDRQPIVYLFLTGRMAIMNIDISEILHREMHQLHVVGIAPVRMKVIAEGELVSANFLTHLSITGHIKLDNSVMVAISKAAREGKLPRLQNLCFTGADVRGGMEDLFREETTLLNITYFTSLAISDNNCSWREQEKGYFNYCWENLTSLSVKDMTEWSIRQLLNAINQSRLTHLMKLCVSLMQNEKCDLRKLEPDKIPLLEHFCVQRCIASKEDLEHLSCLTKFWSLQTLDISHSRQIAGNLSILINQHFRSLENLILHDCELNEQDLINLDRANEERRISRLENLDLSENRLVNEIFGAISSIWSSLKKLRIDNAPPNQLSTERNGFDILRPLLDKGCIPSIEELRITATDFSPGRTGRWKHLERLNIVEITDIKLISLLDCLVKSVQMGDLPSLQTVCLLTDRQIGGILSTDNSKKFSRFIQKDIYFCMVKPYQEEIMINAGLAQ